MGKPHFIAWVLEAVLESQRVVVINTFSKSINIRKELVVVCIACYVVCFFCL
jgi:hypothetical protein